jgi:hypothetical protein
MVKKSVFEIELERAKRLYPDLQGAPVAKAVPIAIYRLRSIISDLEARVRDLERGK